MLFQSSYYNSPNVVCVWVCVCVCLSFNYSFIFATIFAKFGQNEGVDLGSEVPWDPRVKNVKQCSMTTKLGPKNPLWKLRMMVTFMEVKGQQRSSAVN